jgi:APA family basic amino acid/polyamine antiporter
LNPLFSTKSVDKLRSDAEYGYGLKRTLTAFDLVLLGVGGIIGTGIFVLTGRAAAANAGPAVALSFTVAAMASAFAGLCYAEMASMIPIAGSAYTYAYATMGELIAWIIGWDLILEYLVGAATVSVGWSGYVCAFFKNVTGHELSATWTRAPFVWDEAAQHLQATGAIINLPAVFIVLAVTAILVVGIKESARFNGIIVLVKVAVVLMFIATAAPFVRHENWVPFIPANTGTFGKFGISGILQGATMVFFAYIGFDAVSTAAQETKNPQRDLPIGILGSLAICTVLYIAVALILTGVVPYTKLSVPHPIAVGIAVTGSHILESAVEVGAIAGLSSVMLVLLLGQPRIFFSMARDGLLPPMAAKVHPALRHAPRHHHHHRLRVRPGRRRAAHRYSRRADQHRHPVRLRAGQPGRDDPAHQAPGHPALVQSPWRHLPRSHLRRPDLGPAHVHRHHPHHHPPLRVDGHRPCHLLHLRREALGPAHRH